MFAYNSLIVLNATLIFRVKFACNSLGFAQVRLISRGSLNWPKVNAGASMRQVYTEKNNPIPANHPQKEVKPRGGRGARQGPKGGHGEGNQGASTPPTKKGGGQGEAATRGASQGKGASSSSCPRAASASSGVSRLRDNRHILFNGYGPPASGRLVAGRSPVNISRIGRAGARGHWLSTYPRWPAWAGKGGAVSPADQAQPSTEKLTIMVGS